MSSSSSRPSPPYSVGARPAELYSTVPPSSVTLYSIENGNAPEWCQPPATVNLQRLGGPEDLVPLLTMFAEGREVVVEGRYDGQGLTARQIMTSCPSKYEPAGEGAAARAGS